MNTPNTDRIITITYRGKTSYDTDWRHSLQRITNTQNGYEHSILDNVLKDSVVDNRIHLLMTSPPKTMKTVNRIKEPVQELLKGGGKGSDTMGKITTFANMAYDTLNALSTNGDGETSPTWQPWMTGVKAWDGSKGGFSFEYEFSFAMGQYGLWNAKEEVVKPILNLIAPALPRSMNNFSMNGPFPTAIQLLSQMVKGAWINIKDNAWNKIQGLLNKDSDLKDDSGAIDNELKGWFEGESLGGLDKVSGALTSIGGGINDVLEDLSNALNTVIQDSYRDYTYDVKFGNFVTFNNMIITNGETSFSNEVDQYGYPIAGTVKLTFEGLVPLAMNYSSTDLVAIKYGGKR